MLADSHMGKLVGASKQRMRLKGDLEPPVFRLGINVVNRPCLPMSDAFEIFNQCVSIVVAKVGSVLMS